jgi:hypothetical protein
MHVVTSPHLRSRELDDLGTLRICFVLLFSSFSVVIGSMINWWPPSGGGGGFCVFGVHNDHNK